MAKPISPKLRAFVTLHALFKYSDKNHRLNTVKVNEYLRPYDLCFTNNRVLKDTARVMREFGIDVQSKGFWGNHGLWIEERPLSESALKQLIYAVSTNPHLSREQATEILQNLTPFVTAYQESLLRSTVESGQNAADGQKLFKTYSVISDAIAAGKPVRFSLINVPDNETSFATNSNTRDVIFAPKSIYQSEGSLFVSSHYTVDQNLVAINLAEISSIEIAQKRKNLSNTIKTEQIC